MPALTPKAHRPVGEAGGATERVERCDDIDRVPFMGITEWVHNSPGVAGASIHPRRVMLPHPAGGLSDYGMDLLRRSPIADCRVTLRGEAGPAVRAALAPLQVDVGDGRTTVHGDVADQAALFGLLDRLRDLGIEIEEVRFHPLDDAAPEGLGT